MRKTIQYILLLLGIVTVVYSVLVPFRAVLSAFSVLSSVVVKDPLVIFMESWSDGYNWMTCVGAAAIVVSVLLLWLFRKSDSVTEPFPAVLLTGGAMLELVAFLQAWTATEGNKYVYNMLESAELDNYYSSTIITVPTTPLSTWEYLERGYGEYMWMVTLGGLMLLAGIVVWIIQRRKVQTVPETVEAAETEEPEQEEPPVVKIMEREEWRISLNCTVMDIRGDYALVKYEDSGVESEVAIALLPVGIDVGDQLKYENYEFERV